MEIVGECRPRTAEAGGQVSLATSCETADSVIHLVIEGITNTTRKENTMNIRNEKWETLSDSEREKWQEIATEYLIEMAWLPLSDDVWATDKYADIIDEKAQELWENDRDDRLASLAE